VTEEQFMKSVIYLLELMFMIGLIGSGIVVLLSTIEDLEVWFTRPTNAETPSDQPGSHPDFTTS
jgi:hypothetical protein